MGEIIDLEEARDSREPLNIDFDKTFRDIGCRYKYTFAFMYPNKPKSLEVFEQFTEELLEPAELEKHRQKIIKQTKKSYLGFKIDEL